MAFTYGSICLWFIIGICHGFDVPSVQLLDGNKMPVVGFGTFLTSPEQTDVAVMAALESGYRHIDTAYVYDNEYDIGKALKKWIHKGGKREDVFITTKLPIKAMRPSDVAEALQLSLNKLGVDYVDMYLIHAPFGAHRTFDHQMFAYNDRTLMFDYNTNHLAIWKELEKQVIAGKVRSLGVSNFNKTQLLRVWENSQIKPTNLQIEINAYLQQDELVDLCHELGIAVTAYSPLGSGGMVHMRRKRETVELPPLIRHDVVKAIAENHNKSPAQVLLRYSLQRNIVVIPKSTNPKRIKENIEVFDFMLTDNEMNQLKKLDMHGKYRKFDFLSFKGVEHHPEYPFADKVPK